MPLEIGPTMIRVQAAAAPVVVGVIGIGAKLEQDRRVLPGSAGRTMKKTSTSAVRRLRPTNLPPLSSTRSRTL